MNSNLSRHSRRAFIKGSAAAVTAAAAAAAGIWRESARSYAQVVGSNADLRVAVVGCNDMGRSHINQLRAIAGVRLVALCDPDSAVLDRDMGVIAAAAGTATPPVIDRYADARKVLERGDVDVITIATPNHWHALMTVWACQAGKDVYVEKPTCHSIWEGRQALNASRKYNRIAQAGTQWRSMPAVFEAFEWIKAGNLGKINVSRGLCYKRRVSLGKTDGPQPTPATCDYDLWCGPAPKEPLRRKNLHYDWHWVWPTGNGDIGNQGAHQMDLARWVLGKTAVAPTVITFGGRFGYIDDGQTPNTVVSVHDYGDAQLIFEVRGLPTRDGAGTQMDKFKGADIGNVVECDGGYLSVTQTASIAFDKDGKQIRRFTGAGVTRDKSHLANFFKAVRSRRREDQNGELLEGHLSSSLCNLSNISYRLGQHADPDAIRQAFTRDAAASETLARFNEHLAANKIDPAKEPVTLGIPLRVNPAAEQIIDNPEANLMLRRQEYREPFVVNEVVA